MKSRPKKHRNKSYMAKANTVQFAVPRHGFAGCAFQTVEHEFPAMMSVGKMVFLEMSSFGIGWEGLGVGCVRISVRTARALSESVCMDSGWCRTQPYSRATL